MRRLVRATAAAALCAAAAAGCGGGDAERRSGGLGWAGRSEAQTVPGLSGDRVVSGTIVNRGTRTVSLPATAAVVLTATGRRLPTAVTFADRFVKPLYIAEQPGRDGDEIEARRVGRLLRLAPGARSPVVVGWRGQGAAALSLGRTTLRLVSRPARGAAAPRAR